MGKPTDELKLLFWIGPHILLWDRFQAARCAYLDVNIVIVSYIRLSTSNYVRLDSAGIYFSVGVKWAHRSQWPPTPLNNHLLLHRKVLANDIKLSTLLEKGCVFSISISLFLSVVIG